MLTETEIKLRLPDPLSVDPTALPLFTGRLSGGWQRVELLNQYFDTPELALDRAGYALRLRRDGDQIIQTFKGRGESLAGFSVRDEWDWYLDSDQLDLQLLAGLDLPEVLSPDTLSRLQPLFRTDFLRTKGTLNWTFDGRPVEVEVALDQGSAVAGERSSGICELELELRQGSPEALLAFALEVAEQLPMMPWDSAKAERGYRLLDPGRKPARPVLNTAVFDQPVGKALPVLGAYLLASAQYATELVTVGEPDAVESLDCSLRFLDEFEHLVERVGGRTVSGSAEQVARLREILFTNLPRDAQARLTELFSRLQSECDWGVLMLGQSERLYLWQKEETGVLGLSLGQICGSHAEFAGLDSLRSAT